MICVGAVTRPHGIRGDVCVDWYADDPSFLADEIRLDCPDGRSLLLRALQARSLRTGLLVRFAGVDDRNAAETLRGATIWIPRDRLPELPEGEAYLDDLLGRRVVLQDGSFVGLLDHVETPAGQMIWSLRDGRSEVLFPARPEFIVSLGDPVVIDPPEGLLETCRSPL